MYIWPTLTFFALIPCVLLSHFRGGLLTWKAVNENQIIINHRVFYVYTHCPGPQRDTLNCVSGCTGSVTMEGYCKDSSFTEDWADLEGVTRFDISSTSTPVILQYSSSAWISLVHPGSQGSWSLRMTLDLSVRSDTGKINQSPVSSVASTIKLFQICSLSDLTFYIPVADFDGDIVRCRFASTINECHDVCGNHVSFLTFDGTSCSFTINSNISTVTAGNYAVALQIEDFTDSSSSVPLSSVPLQFIINVNTGTICSDGVYLVYPTPTVGEKLQAQNGSLQLYARARVNNTSVTKFHIMSPLNFTMSAIIQHGTNEFEVTITLDSNGEDPNATHVMCFSAETNERTSSESRCITVHFGDIDDCQPNPCQHNGTCYDLVNGYQCDCVPGFNETNCENNIDECASQPCQNNGTCIDLINGYTCNCTDGFNETNCSNNIDDCQPNPCQNNGTCRDLVNDYQCDCVPGFNETNCENNIDECASQPCQNNGTCIDLINDYTCNCTDGFNETNCSNNIDDCQPNPCQNNGTCRDLVNDFQCDCVPGFNETNCENNIDECASQPCQNNATCIDLINDYTCNCTDGFNETNCSNNIDECASQPCQNNGTCIDLINDYQCNCTDGFSGTTCTVDVDLCASSPCKNNGTCIDLTNIFQCQCPLEFNGTTCSTESHLTKFTMILKIDVSISEDLSSSTDYSTVESKVHIALTDIYSTIPGSTVIIHGIRKGSLIVDFDLIIPDDPVSKIQVVDTVYKLVNGLAFVNYSGEIVNVTSASFNSSAGTIIISNSTDGCSILNSQNVCSPGYRCHEFNNYTVACIPIINKRAAIRLYCKQKSWKTEI